MKKLVIILTSCFILLGIAIGAFALSINANMKEIRELPLNNIEVNILVDGSYEGEYFYEDQIGARVNVTILNGSIAEITLLKHVCGKGTIAEVILDDIVIAQTLDVDAIAGATTSSHVLKLAVQNALEKAK